MCIMCNRNQFSNDNECDILKFRLYECYKIKLNYRDVEHIERLGFCIS